MIAAKAAIVTADEQFDLAFRYLQARGVPRSLRTAYAHFAAAAAAGHSGAKAVRRNFLAAGIGTAADWTAAVDLLRGDTSEDARRQLALVEAMDLTPDGRPRMPPPSKPISDAPDVRLFPHFFTADECRFLIDCAQPAFQPATVGHVSGGYRRQLVPQVRTCDVAAFPWVAENPVIHALHNRIAAASGTHTENGEPLQVLRYAPGQEFKPHGDATEDRENQRVFTMLVYLNDAYTGGETLFLKNGLKVRGETGDAVLFRNADDRGNPDANAVHAGLPVQSGLKLLASRWIRQKRFGPSE